MREAVRRELPWRTLSSLLKEPDAGIQEKVRRRRELRYSVIHRFLIVLEKIMPLWYTLQVQEQELGSLRVT